MKTTKVRDMMVPLDEYAVVSEDATLYEAVLALEHAQRGIGPGRDMLRAVLVCDKNRRIVGKLRQWDVVKGLEPSYEKVDEIAESSGYDFRPELVETMLKDYGLWHEPFEDICRKGAEIIVRDIMSIPEAGEYMAEDASIGKAMHRLATGRYQSLLITRGDEVVGVLRLSDVFKEICNKIKSCRI